ncbi:MAG: ROK family protein [Mycobacteriaceae bacterium]|nr:ROK family protein [Mycobacteriaceae bacterium]
MAGLTLAVDVGASKIAVGLVDSAGALVQTATLPTPSGDAEAVWGVAQRLITGVSADTVVRGVGIACAGPIHLPTGTASPINIAAWRDFPIVDRVAQLVPGVPVRLGGDGLCMALGEHRRGAGRDAQFLLGVVASTGVGGGLLLDGVPYRGATGNAGHVGHVVVELDGQPCSCGGHGCVETIASGPRLAQWAREHGWTAPAESGAKELADAAEAGNEVAVLAFRRSAIALAAMIASVAAVGDLDLAVIGGGVATAGRLLFAPLREALDGYARLDYLRALRVVPAALGGDAGLVGAAALVDA